MLVKVSFHEKIECQTKVRRTSPYRRTEIWPVLYGSVTVDFDRYRVCSLHRPVQGGPRTSKPSDRYVPPVPGGTENLVPNTKLIDL
ncbi:hypothetical protein GW17_00030677 [Ensete ventricosum]|nr:hypothetical protein GW17_00030677 [Ensete ventricosum]